jgi:hypothetical protein
VGTCFPPDVVVHVDGDPGARPADFPSVAAAIASVGAGERRVIVVHEQDSGLGYPGVTISTGTVIALLGAPGESPVIQGTAGNPGVTVDGAGSALYMSGVRVALSSGVGLRVNGALAWVDRSATETSFAGTGNVAVGELPLMTPEAWFVSYGIGDYHLQDDGLDLFADVAQWQAEDPSTDIDGDLRPNIDGTPDYAGADVP